MNPDEAALPALLRYAHDAIDQQAPHIADQLNAAMRDGRTWFEFVEHEDSVFAMVFVDGNRVARVDVRNLLEDL